MAVRQFLNTQFIRIMKYSNEEERRKNPPVQLPEVFFFPLVGINVVPKNRQLGVFTFSYGYKSGTSNSSSISLDSTLAEDVAEIELSYTGKLQDSIIESFYAIFQKQKAEATRLRIDLVGSRIVLWNYGFSSISKNPVENTNKFVVNLTLVNTPVQNVNDLAIDKSSTVQEINANGAV